MPGTLLLDFDTVATDPRFFSLLALVERAAGRRIVVFDADPRRKNGEELVTLQLRVPINRYIQWTPQPVEATSIDARHAAKTTVAKSLRDKSPVLWVDVEFGDWRGENLGQLQNITILNWAQVLKAAPPPMVGQA